MTNVSKQVLPKDAQEKLFTQLAKVFYGASEKQTASLFGAVLSPTEQIMLVKRVAIVLLLLKDRSTYEIAKVLLVSDRTVRVVKSDLKSGRYDALVDRIAGKKFDQEVFWKTLEKILTLNMPRYGTSLSQLKK